MKMTRWVSIFLICFGVAFAQTEGPRPAPTAAPSLVAAQTTEPGLTYGKSAELPLPKTILFSAGPEEIVKDAEEWSGRGVSAFFLDFVARDWSSDIWARDQKPWTIGESDDTFRVAKEANAVCKRIGSETFLKIAFDYPLEWFNDISWQHILHNFRQYAIFARETDCTGIALDIEYAAKQYDFGWEGYTYEGYTRTDLFQKISERSTDIMRALLDEFPGMVFLTFPETGFSLGTVIHVAWIEEMAKRGAPGGLHYCTESTYRHPNIRYMFGHAWACNELFDKLLTKRGRKYWREKCSIAEGVWPFGFNYQSVYDPGMPYEEFRQGYAASLMASKRYNWIYSHNCRELIIGRALDKYTGKEDIKAYLRVIADREVVTTPKYVALAKELRAMTLRDYSSDLGLTTVPTLVGPNDAAGLELSPLTQYADAAMAKDLWDIGMQTFVGKVMDLQDRFRTVTHWMVIGPFANDEKWSGYSAIYPPEQGIDLNAVYDGLNGKVSWKEYQRKAPFVSVDFKETFQPSEQVCAYALCYVTSPAEQEAQIRIGTNDFGKAWLGGRVVYEYAREGLAVLDRDLIPITLPKGKTPILVKACNGKNNWGFVFRITDKNGLPLKGIEFSPRP